MRERGRGHRGGYFEHEEEEAEARQCVTGKVGLHAYTQLSAPWSLGILHLSTVRHTIENHQEWQQKHCEKAQRGADDARGEVFKSAEDGRPGMWELLGVSAEERKRRGKYG